MKAELIQIPVSVYSNVINHLKAHAETDDWAKNCLEQLEASAKPVPLGRTGPSI